MNDCYLWNVFGWDWKNADSQIVKQYKFYGRADIITYSKQQ